MPFPRWKTHCGCRSVKNNARSDIAGQRFGRLVAQSPTDRRDEKGSVIWHCRCDCGNEVEVTEDGLLHGNYKSCGCLRQEIWKELPGQLHMVDGTCVEILEKRKHRSDNTSGFRGIYHMNNGKYRATIGFKGKRFYIGTFKNYEDAVQARLEAENTIHGGFVQAWYTWNSLAEKDPKWAEEHPLVYEIERVNGEFQVITNMNRQMELPVHK